MKDQGKKVRVVVERYPMEVFWSQLDSQKREDVGKKWGNNIKFFGFLVKIVFKKKITVSNQRKNKYKREKTVTKEG